MVLPIFVAAWLTDATVRAAIEQQLQAAISSAGSGAMLTGADVALQANAIGATSTWSLRLGGRYAHGLGLSFTGGAAPPTDNGSLSLGGNGSVPLGPRVQMGVDAQGSISTRFGVRAVDGAAVLDPFQVGNRLAYSLGAGANLNAITGKRSTFRLSAGYTQDGGLAADLPEAVGLDAITVRAATGFGWELGQRDSIVPELRLAQTHFEHAILDVDLRRGRADTTALTAVVGESHAFSRRLRMDLSGGATVTRSVIAAPEARLAVAAAPELKLGVEWVGQRARVSGSYSLAYASLGPRLAYGQQHALLGELALRPVSGAKWRDLLVHATARFTHGSAEIAIPAAAGSDAPPGTGWLTTTTFAAGALVEWPLARAVAFRGGVDLQMAQGTVDPAPLGGPPGLGLQAVVLFGIAGTLSTDPALSARRDPLEEEEARERAEPATWQRMEDRSREYRPRPGDGIDGEILDTDREPPSSVSPD